MSRNNSLTPPPPPHVLRRRRRRRRLRTAQGRRPRSRSVVIVPPPSETLPTFSTFDGTEDSLLAWQEQEFTNYIDVARIKRSNEVELAVYIDEYMDIIHITIPPKYEEMTRHLYELYHYKEAFSSFIYSLVKNRGQQTLSFYNWFIRDNGPYQLGYTTPLLMLYIEDELVSQGYQPEHVVSGGTRKNRRRVSRKQRKNRRNKKGGRRISKNSNRKSKRRTNKSRRRRQ